MILAVPRETTVFYLVWDKWSKILLPLRLACDRISATRYGDRVCSLKLKEGPIDGQKPTPSRPRPELPNYLDR